MSRKKWFDESSATTYDVVHRAHDDPLYYDNDAPQVVLVEAPKRDVNTYTDPVMASRLQATGLDAHQGSSYMKHLAALGYSADDIQVTRLGFEGEEEFEGFSETEQAENDFLPKTNFGSSARTEKPKLPAELFPSKQKVRITYESQQAIPDSIAGLQPDMDPRLREVLEALEDENFVEDDVDEFFDELVADGVVEDEAQWRLHAPKEELIRREGEADWEFEFRKFKMHQQEVAKDSKASSTSSCAYSAGLTSTHDLNQDIRKLDLNAQNAHDKIERTTVASTVSRITSKKAKRRKPRIGAKTDLTGFSMSSSANFRNAGLTLVDDRFDKLEAIYQEDEEYEEDPGEFDLKKERADLENILDEFLSARKSSKMKVR